MSRATVTGDFICEPTCTRNCDPDRIRNAQGCRLVLEASHHPIHLKSSSSRNNFPGLNPKRLEHRLDKFSGLRGCIRPLRPLIVGNHVLKMFHGCVDMLWGESVLQDFVYGFLRHCGEQSPSSPTSE